MKSIRQVAVCALFAFFCAQATARVESEVLCFQAAANEKIHLAFKYYLDTDLNQQLGALAQYGASSKPLIPLVFLDDATSDDTLDWELHWLEIVDGKPGGTYSLSKPKAATVAAAYLKYKGARNGKEVLFQPSRGLNGECTIGARRAATR